MRLKGRRTIDIITGWGFATIFLVIGVRLFTIGDVNNTPSNPTGQIVLTYILGSTFGYNFGLAIKRGDEPGKGEFVILASFFGTLVVAFTSYVIYSVVYVKSYDSIYSLALLLVTMVAFTAVTHTDTVERRNLKPLLELFSNKASPVVLSGYATASVTDVGTAAIVSVVAAIAMAILPKVLGRFQNFLDDRAEMSRGTRRRRTPVIEQ